MLSWHGSSLRQNLISSLSPYHFQGVDHYLCLTWGGTSADAITFKSSHPVSSYHFQLKTTNTFWECKGIHSCDDKVFKSYFGRREVLKSSMLENHTMRIYIFALLLASLYWTICCNYKREQKYQHMREGVYFSNSLDRTIINHSMFSSWSVVRQKTLFLK